MIRANYVWAYRLQLVQHITFSARPILPVSCAKSSNGSYVYNSSYLNRQVISNTGIYHNILQIVWSFMVVELIAAICLSYLW